MFCNTCKYSNIKHINYHETLLDTCIECNICSLQLIDYYEFVMGLAIEYKIGNISRLTDISILNKKDAKKLNKFLSFFEINLAELYKTDYKCNVCEDELLEFTFLSGLNIYICMECMRIYFYIDEFDLHIEKAVNSCNSNYFKNIKRFLQGNKRGKNNVKK